ncbi:MAG: dethiobiotin synthase [Hyphomicrobiaceae bacterium]|nr:dethiobiotin synthase [Hyphomicrobiaceae bacterium]
MTTAPRPEGTPSTAATRGFIIAGTNTDIGKTVFAAALAEAIDADYWKPVQAGTNVETDSEVVARLANGRAGRVHPECYRLTTPCSPHRAAMIDGVSIDLSLLVSRPQTVHPLLIELAGGLLVPLTDDTLQADIVARWGLPVVLCATTALGTINHSLLSVEAIARRGLVLHGIAFIGEANDETEAIICAFARTRRLGRMPLLQALDTAHLAAAFARNFRREDFAP